MESLRYINILCAVSYKVQSFSRCINTSSSLLAKNIALSKQGKVFNKLLGTSSKKKRKFIFDDAPPPSTGNKLNLGQPAKNYKENSRRKAALNTLFMKHISDLLVTGNFEHDVLSKGLEISRVSMNPDFNQLNVFWGCHTEENIIYLENVLPDFGYSLRHELSQLRVMGVVPRILFVKDKHFGNGAKVDYLLRIADFGEDHVPSELESDFKVGPSVMSEKNNLQSGNEALSETTDSDDEEEMPLMRNDIFNLDHDKIMQKIMKRMVRSRAIHRFEPNLMIKSDGKDITYQTSSNVEAGTMTEEERREALAKFVVNRRIVQEKMQNKHKSDQETFSLQDEDNDEDEVDFVVEDYLDEDFDEKKLEN